MRVLPFKTVFRICCEILPRLSGPWYQLCLLVRLCTILVSCVNFVNITKFVLTTEEIMREITALLPCVQLCYFCKLQHQMDIYIPKWLETLDYDQGHSNKVREYRGIELILIIQFMYTLHLSPFLDSVMFFFPESCDCSIDIHIHRYRLLTVLL